MIWTKKQTACETCCTPVFKGKAVGHWLFVGVAQEHNNTGESAERIYLTYSLRAAICVLYASVLGERGSVEDCSYDPAGSSHLMWKLTAANLPASLLCAIPVKHFEAMFNRVQYNCTHLHKHFLVSSAADISCHACCFHTQNFWKCEVHHTEFTYNLISSTVVITSISHNYHLVLHNVNTIM